MTNNNNITVAEYLLARLKSLNVDHVFGIPGDFILPLLEIMVDDDIEQIAACNELNAGYAADGYARIRGLGAAAVTYGPGSFSIVNAVAGAYSEEVPVVIISGGPSTEAYKTRPVLHHLMLDRYETSINIFKNITAYASLLDQAESAASEIDKALSICLAEKRPVFLEIPTDVQLAKVPSPQGKLDYSSYITTDKELGRQAASALVDKIINSERTVILPGHEIHRWGLQEKVLKILELSNIPVASVFVGKADYLEYLPNCIGSYQGAGSQAEVRDYVESADTVVLLGMVPSDFNLGGFTAKLSNAQTVTVWNNKVEIDGKIFSGVSIVDVVNELLERLPENVMQKDTQAPVQCFSHSPDSSYSPEPNTPLTNKRFYDRLVNYFQKDDVILADAGCAINITHLQLPENTSYIASCYWASIGMAFGATLGACFAADEGQRIIAVEGDGSFQMTAQELSSMARYGKTPIVFVVNNKGYTAERLIHDGPFNDIPEWKYHLLPEAFGGGEGIDVHTEEELEAAMEKASSYEGPGPLLIEVHIDPLDASEAFKLMSEVLRSH